MLKIAQSFSKILTNIAIAPTARIQCILPVKAFHSTHTIRCTGAAKDSNESVADEGAEQEQSKEKTAADLKRLKNDRTQIIPVETSMRYLQSAAYKQTYGDQFVWEQYRRNHKGLYPPKKTRKTCIRKGVISTGNPCPICRDEYLVLDHRNLDLLRQFISPQSGKVLSYSKTGLCQKKHLQLLVAVERAWDYGLLTFDVPFREYDYSEYYDNNLQQSSGAQSTKSDA